MRNIPADNLAYPVLLQFDTGSSGSSFILRTDSEIFIITAKHVIFDGDNVRGQKIILTCPSRDIDDDHVKKMLVDLTKLVPIKHGQSDIAAIEIGKIRTDSAKGAYLVEHHDGISISEGQDLGTVSVNAQTTTKQLKDVLISNDVYLYGYPTSLGIKDLPQFDYNKPLLRKGIIANIYKNTGTIILDCPVYYGNSGGPVVEVEQDGPGFHHKVIGVVSQFIPFVEHWENKQNKLVNTEVSNSGYSVVVSMDRVFELIGYLKK